MCLLGTVAIWGVSFSMIQTPNTLDPHTVALVLVFASVGPFLSIFGHWK